MFPGSRKCGLGNLMKRCHRKLGDIHFHDKESVDLGTSWRGSIANLEICISMRKVVWCGAPWMRVSQHIVMSLNL
jgi:uncharacterized protein with PIN domain